LSKSLLGRIGISRAAESAAEIRALLNIDMRVVPGAISLTRQHCFGNLIDEVRRCTGIAKYIRA